MPFYLSINDHAHALDGVELSYCPGLFRVLSSGIKDERAYYIPPLFICCRVVESVGEDVDEVSVGDTVIPTFMPDCGDCVDCRSKKSNLCSKLPFKVSPWMPRHETSRFTDLNGEVLYHFLFVSSFSEYTVVDVAHVTKIDPSIAPNRACLLSCGVSTGIGHVLCYKWKCHLSLTRINLNKLNIHSELIIQALYLKTHNLENIYAQQLNLLKAGL